MLRNWNEKMPLSRHYHNKALSIVKKVLKEKIPHKFEIFGYKCIITRNKYTGNLIGWLGLPTKHPLNSIGISDEDSTLPKSLQRSTEDEKIESVGDLLDFLVADGNDEDVTMDLQFIALKDVSNDDVVDYLDTTRVIVFNYFKYNQNLRVNLLIEYFQNPTIMEGMSDDIESNLYRNKVYRDKKWMIGKLRALAQIMYKIQEIASFTSSH